MSEAGEVDLVIKSLRKPEVRTPYTQGLLSVIHDYFGEVLEQSNSPRVRELTQRKGMIFPIGSLLRGTARPGSSDVDFVILYDSENQPPLVGYSRFSAIIGQSEEYHPKNISFEKWVAQRFRSDPKLKTYYDERRRYLEEVTPEISSKARALYGKTPLPKEKISEERLERYFISTEAVEVDTDSLARQIQSLATLSQGEFDKLISEERNEPAEILLGGRYEHFSNVMGVVVPMLLTCTTDFAVESYPDTLLHHQKKIVKALSFLEQENPYIFGKIYEHLSKNFSAAVLWEGGSHALDSEGYYEDLLAKYVRSSGKFQVEQELGATRLLKVVKRQVKFPSLESFRASFL